jgi:hypothetical protein
MTPRRIPPRYWSDGSSVRRTRGCIKNRLKTVEFGAFCQDKGKALALRYSILSADR